LGRYKSIDDFEQNDFRRSDPRFQGENFNKNLEIIHKFNEFGSKKGVTASQLCLAWVIAQVKYLKHSFKKKTLYEYDLNTFLIIYFIRVITLLLFPVQKKWNIWKKILKQEKFNLVLKNYQK
jgi:hypothetical protein